METRSNLLTPLILLSCFVAFVLPNVAHAEHEYNYFSDRLSREHRDGSDVDEWVERGNATINASPYFEEGARLTAWASKFTQEDDYEFAIASAVYFLEIPSQAQYVEILVRYRGEPHESDIEDYEPVGGRIWIRNTKREYARLGYDDKHAEETRYGDTFVLRAKRRSETIKIPVAGHVDNGFLEMHVVAQDGEQLDIEYIDVSTYRKQRHVDKYHRYARSYQWRPWHHYTYLYFYDGPCYYATDQNYYIRWSYPIYDRHYFSIRYSYGNYLHRYYTHHPHYYSNSNRGQGYVQHNNKLSMKKRTRLNQWSQEHESVRRQYTRSRLSVAGRTTKQTSVQPRVRSVIEKHRTKQPALADREDRNSTITRKRKPTDYQTRSYALAEERGRTLRSYRRSPANPNSATQSDRGRYFSKSRPDNSKQNEYTRSNAEHPTRLHNRSRSYSGQSRVSSSSESGSSSSAERKRSDVSSAPRKQSIKSRTSSRSRTSSAQSQQSSGGTVSSSDNDDEEKRTSKRNRSSAEKKRKR